MAAPIFPKRPGDLEILLGALLGVSRVIVDCCDGILVTRVWTRFANFPREPESGTSFF